MPHRVSPLRHYHNLSCVYQLKNTHDEFVYVGSTNNMYRRWFNHRSTLNRGVCPNFFLQTAWTRDGEAAFVLEILQETNDLIYWEQHYINQAVACGKSYNIAPLAGTSLGKKLLPQTAERLRIECPHIFEGRRERMTEFNQTEKARKSRRETMSIVANTPEAIARSSAILTTYNKSEKNREIARQKIIAYNEQRRLQKLGQ